MIDLLQVQLALRYATAQSLVILDEFGKGTNACGTPPLLVVDDGRWDWVVGGGAGSVGESKARLSEIDYRDAFPRIVLQSHHDARD